MQILSRETLWCLGMQRWCSYHLTDINTELSCVLKNDNETPGITKNEVRQKFLDCAVGWCYFPLLLVLEGLVSSRGSAPLPGGALHCCRCCWNNFHPFYFPLQHQLGHSGRCGRVWDVLSVLWQVSRISKSWSPWGGFRSVACSWWNPGEANASGKSDCWRIATVLEAQFGQCTWILEKWSLGPPRIHRCPIEYFYSKGYITIYFNFKKRETVLLWKIKSDLLLHLKIPLLTEL